MTNQNLSFLSPKQRSHFRLLAERTQQGNNPTQNDDLRWMDDLQQLANALAAIADVRECLVDIA